MWVLTGDACCLCRCQYVIWFSLSRGTLGSLKTLFNSWNYGRSTEWPALCNFMRMGLGSTYFPWTFGCEAYVRGCLFTFQQLYGLIMRQVVDHKYCRYYFGNSKVTNLFMQMMRLRVSLAKSKVQLFVGLLNETVKFVHVCRRTLIPWKLLHTLVTFCRTTVGFVKKFNNEMSQPTVLFPVITGPFWSGAALPDRFCMWYAPVHGEGRS